MPDAGNRAAIYRRVSTAAQVEKFSLAAQRRILFELAKTQGWTVVEQFEDAGISGATMESRPAFLRMLADARERKFDHVLVVDLDRISRSQDLRTWGEVLEVFRDADIRIVTPAQSLDPKKAEDTFLTHILGAVAALEKTKIAQRARRGQVEAVRKGRRLGGTPPFGFRYDRNERRLVVNESEGPTVPVIFELYLAGHTQLGVARELNRRGLLSRSGRPWLPHVVRQILRSPIYTGFVVWNRSNQTRPRWQQRPRSEWVWSDAPTHEPLVDQVTWDRVQLEMTRRGHAATQPSYEESPFLLSGFVFCSCGERMAGHSTVRKNSDGSTKKVYRRYMCQGFAKGGPRHPAVNATPLEEEVIDRIAGLTTSLEVLERARKELLLDRMRAGTTAAKDLDALRVELEDIRRKQGVTYQDRLDGRLTAAQWDRFNADLLAREDEVSRRIEAEERALLSSGGGASDVSSVLAVLRDFRRIFASLSNLDRKLVLREVVAEVRVHDGGVRAQVVLRSPWQEILGEPGVKASPVPSRRKAL